MKIKCPICGKRVKVRRDGKLYAHLATGVPCHGPLLEKEPKKVQSNYKDGDYGRLCDFIMGKKESK